MMIAGHKDSLNGHYVIEKETEEDRKPIEEPRLTSIQEKHGQDKPNTETFGVCGEGLYPAVDQLIAENDNDDLHIYIYIYIYIYI